MRVGLLLVLLSFSAATAQTRLGVALEGGGAVRWVDSPLASFVQDYNRVNASVLLEPFGSMASAFSASGGVRLFVETEAHVASVGLDGARTSRSVAARLSEDGQTASGGRDLDLQITDWSLDAEWGPPVIRLVLGTRLRTVTLTSTQLFVDGTTDGAAPSDLSGVFEGRSLQPFAGLTLAGYLALSPSSFAELRLRLTYPLLSASTATPATLSTTDGAGTRLFFPADFEAWLDGERGPGNAIPAGLRDLDVRVTLAVGLWPARP